MIIYKITNLINNKIYIGQTKQDFKNYYGSGKRLRDAKNKYKIENFKKEIIVEGDFNKLLSDELEKHYIRLYNSNNRLIGYNLTIGGQSSGTKSKGRKHSKETIDKMIKTRTGKSLTKYAYEQRMKQCRIPVLQYDLQGNFLFEFISQSEASRQTNSRISEICSGCKGNSKSYNGFMWKYKTDNFPLKINKLKRNNKWHKNTSD